MSITKLFKEGILVPEEYEDWMKMIGNLPTDEKTIKGLYDEMIKMIRDSLLLRLFEEQFKSQYIEAIENNDESEKDLFFDVFEGFLRENDEILEDVRNMFKDFAILIQYNISLPAGRSKLYHFVTSASFSRPKWQPTEKELFKIKFKISIPALLYCVSERKENTMEKEFLSIYEHELVHAMQNADKSLEQVNKMTGSRQKNLKSMERYIGTPIEIPAWGKSIASVMYRYSGNDYDEAIDNLRRGNNVASDSNIHGDMVDYVLTQQRSGNRKAKKLLKYAFQYLEYGKNKKLGSHPK